MSLLPLQPLTAKAFAAFGEVIEVPHEAVYENINDGTCRRYNALAHIEISDGAAGLSIFRAAARAFPLSIKLLERHPQGSQAFMPLGDVRFIIVAAPDAGGVPDWDNVQAFSAGSGQGINFYRNSWHHPLIAVGQGGDFLVADRLSAAGENLEEVVCPAGYDIQIAAPVV